MSLQDGKMKRILNFFKELLGHGYMEVYEPKDPLTQALMVYYSRKFLKHTESISSLISFKPSVSDIFRRNLKELGMINYKADPNRFESQWVVRFHRYNTEW